MRARACVCVCVCLRIRAFIFAYVRSSVYIIITTLELPKKISAAP